MKVENGVVKFNEDLFDADKMLNKQDTEHVTVSMLERALDDYEAVMCHNIPVLR